ncbi:hypothetical protein AB0I16_18930 [Streptomyces sp. NPDC050703]|uniref:hypothetical protein n=1 Tax=Streptomyces sp. NPDC050703 TaxID=3157218 RepID=UPI0034380899
MTVLVDRHELPSGLEAEQFAEQLQEYFFEGVDELDGSASIIDAVFNTLVLNLRARCVVDPRAEAVETWEAAVTAMQLGSALFTVTVEGEGTVECRINRKVPHLTASSGSTSR